MKVQYSKVKIIGSLLLGTLLLGATVLVLYGAYTRPTDYLEPRMLMLKWLGPLAALAFLWMEIMLLLKLFSGVPKMIVDETGITVNDPNYGFFPWEEIARVFITQRQVSLTRSIALLVLMPRDVNAALARFSGYKLRTARSNMKMTGGLPIIMQNIAGNPQDVAGAICEYAQQQITSHVTAPPVSAGP